ncbi:hypothetical protein [Hespellia stercorisuis]|uniref:Uncharacterized protein n=1 Tax=Hespellia stercorisuis DSM 15480 TaxID=1121950 RepID=A0A1M6X0V7_9FIRM|nr:hypothetical protein [Hespellia stercorisuis]SHK99465.1 hypothetical protein SAMN02745243_04137 [Hespellia stercorisuis DSM 15480]
MAKQFKQTTEKVKQEIISASDNAVTLFSKADKQKYNRILKSIDTELNKVEKSYLAIAFKVHALYKDKLFEIDGFKNIYELAQEKYNLSRGTCNNYINIVDKFGHWDKETGDYTGLQEQYQNFKSSQLILMLSMTDEQRAMVKPDMTIREIREYRALCDSQSAEDELEDDANTIDEETHSDSGNLEDGDILNVPEDNDIETIIKETNRMMVFECPNVNDFKKKLDQNTTVLNDTYIDFKNTNKDIRPKITVCLEW